MLRAVTFFLCYALSGGVYAQANRLDFAGVPANSTANTLTAAGFACNVVGGPQEVLCVSQQPGVVELGIPVYRREVRLMYSVPIYIRAISTPTQDPATLIQSAFARISAMYREKERPRFLDLVDNTHRRFFAISQQHTLSVSMTPVQHPSGGASLSMALFYPAAHH